MSDHWNIELPLWLYTEDGRPLATTRTLQVGDHAVHTEVDESLPIRPGDRIGIQVLLPAASWLQPVFENLPPIGTVQRRVAGEAGGRTRLVIGLRRPFRGPWSNPVRRAVAV